MNPTQNKPTESSGKTAAPPENRARLTTQKHTRMCKGITKNPSLSILKRVENRKGHKYVLYFFEYEINQQKWWRHPLQQG